MNQKLMSQEKKYKEKTGVLLINLGTATHYNKKAVRKFLLEFLDDPRVIDLPWWIRKILLYCLILPLRTQRTSQAYATIWDQEKGSPLLYHSQRLAQELSIKLGEDYQVELGMRYNQPNIAQALKKLQNECQKITILPLFPQYSSSVTGSAIEKSLKNIFLKNNIPTLKIIRHFYDNGHYLNALAALISTYRAQNTKDMIIFSFHSLPQSHVRHPENKCLTTCTQFHPCPVQGERPLSCYRAQCYETARLLAQRLGLSNMEYRVAFQSRLGQIPWIGPSLTEMMEELVDAQVRNVMVLCPSFVVDCLETLEEIGVRAKEQWLALGGSKFTLVPCLNAHSEWVAAVANMIVNG